MKILLLMRHAKAEPEQPGGDDKSRPLAPDGVVGATAIGRFLAGGGYLPDLALVSDARRTRATMSALAPAMPIQPRVAHSPLMYHADAEELLAHAREHGEDVRVLMLVGHNPAIAELAAMLAQQGDPSALAAMSGGFPPGAVAVFKASCATWDKLAPACTLLERFATPKTVAAANG